MKGEVPVADALVEGPAGVRLLSGGVGRQVLAQATRRELGRLFRSLAPVEGWFDLVIVDHGAGIGYATVAQLAASKLLIIVTQPETPALSDAYALFKRATLVNGDFRAGLVVNGTRDREEGLEVWRRLRDVAERFLGRAPELAGWVPRDEAVPRSVGARLPVLLGEPESPGARAMAELARWPAIGAVPAGGDFFERARRSLR